ncbi:helix-turn-helix domain-containing protein, partial [Enterococcus faecium]
MNFISKLERGQKKNISILKLNAICRALEISISELLQEESNILLAHL